MAFEQTSAPLSALTIDPTGPHIATSCFDFLLIELVPMAYRLASEIATREQNALGRKSNFSSASGPDKSHKQSGQPAAAAGNNRRHSGTTASTTGTAKGTVTAAPSQQNGKTGGAGAGGAAAAHNGLGVGGIGGTVAGLDEDETREMIVWRLDNMGYRVGLGIVDKFARDKPRFTDTLDVIKFLCKDLWLLVFKKQIDNLKTNHRGVYVLTDNSFRPLSKMSMERGRDGIMAQAQPFLYFPAGLLRGALASMGIVATVQAESSELPGATFQIRTLPAR